MLEEVLADGDSIIHRRDARVKVVTAMAFAALTAVVDGFLPLFFALAVAVAMVLFAGLPHRAVVRRIIVVNGFVLFLWLMLPFTYPGEPVFHIGPLTATREGFKYALLISIKSNAIILACISLLSTTHIVDLGRALGRLYVPEKIIHVLLFMMRYLGVMWREYVRLRSSMQARCFRPRANIHTYRSYANMVGMLLIKSYETAEAVYAAMLCRGFRGKFYALDDFALTGVDIAFSVAVSVSLIMIGVLEWGMLQ